MAWVTSVSNKTAKLCIEGKLPQPGLYRAKFYIDDVLIKVYEGECEVRTEPEIGLYWKYPPERVVIDRDGHKWECVYLDPDGDEICRSGEDFDGHLVDLALKTDLVTIS